VAAASLNPQTDGVTVLGAGNMGSGIAQVFAQAGYSVRLRDLDEPRLAKGRASIEKTLEGAIARQKLTPEGRDRVLARIETTTDLAAAVRGARLVVEAIFEEEALKRSLFAELSGLVDARALVATNTSSLSVTRLQDGFPHPERVAGLHFFYPAAINRLVEVVGGDRSSPETLATLEALSFRLRKVPIRVADRAGFAVNRFFVPYLNEATRLAQDDAASLATIEEVGRELFGTTLGPFELMNVTGIPIAYHSMRSLEAAFGRPYAPSSRLKAQFELGRPWAWRDTEVTPERKPAVRDRLRGLVYGIAAELVEEEVATPEATDRGATVGLRWARGPFAMMSADGLRSALDAVEAYARSWDGAFPVAPALAQRARNGETRWPMRWVRVDRRDRLAWVLLDRPEVLNSLNSEVLTQLDESFGSLAAEPELRAVVLAGSGPVFAAGADIAEMAGKRVTDGRDFGFVGQAVCRRIETFPRPVIALVEGYALGGGLELALACDFIVASEDAKLGLPEVTVGIHPGFGGASRLTRLIGRARTKLLVYSGTPVSAEEAYELGFVARVFPAATARAETEALARTIAERAPLPIRWVKEVIDRGMDSSLDAALRLEGESAGHTFATEDKAEGMRAFLERRKPEFRGR
jgi:enoyl-CoA hydratase/3-hydroxyacyl-CoA dehydrogenase